MALIVGALRVGVWGFTLGTSRRVRALATMGFTIGSTHFTVDHLNGAARQGEEDENDALERMHWCSV